MDSAENDMEQGVAEGHRKPRLALMGEFSAGKSTLSNMLLGCAPLPTRVIATRLPPVWISWGEDAAFCVGHDGRETPLDLADLNSVDLDQTRLIRLYLKSDTLQLCDLIDMPGISDPNMSSDVWQSVFDLADCVVWCTHATQAWRQSEAATWDSVRDRTLGENLLLITQFDKLTTERDQARVLARVRKETDGMFRAVYPVSLLRALSAGEDVEQWDNSGAAAFTEHLVEILLSLSPEEDGGLAGIVSHVVAEDSAEDQVFHLSGADDGQEPDQQAGDAEPVVDMQDDDDIFASLAEDAAGDHMAQDDDTAQDDSEQQDEQDAFARGVRVMPKRVRRRTGSPKAERLPKQTVAYL